MAILLFDDAHTHQLIGGESHGRRTRCSGRGVLGNGDAVELVTVDDKNDPELTVQAIANLAQQGWLVPGAVVVLEEAVSHLPEQVEGFEKLDQRRYGDSAIGIFQLGQK